MKSSSLSRKEKKNLARILIALAMFAIIFVVDKIVVLGSVFKVRPDGCFPFFCILWSIF